LARRASNGTGECAILSRGAGYAQSIAGLRLVRCDWTADARRGPGCVLVGSTRASRAAARPRRRVGSGRAQVSAVRDAAFNGRVFSRGAAIAERGPRRSLKTPATQAVQEKDFPRENDSGLQLAHAVPFQNVPAMQLPLAEIGSADPELPVNISSVAVLPVRFQQRTWLNLAAELNMLPMSVTRRMSQVLRSASQALA